MIFRNMFVVGMQLKVFVGLILLTLAAKYIPVISDLIYSEIKIMVNEVVKVLSP